MKKILLGVGLVIVVGLGTVFAIPAVRYPVLAYLQNERLYSGRPVSYWIAALKDSDANVRKEAALTLGEYDIVKEHSGKEDPLCRLVVFGLVETIGDQDGAVRKAAATSYLLYPRDSPVPADGPTITRLNGVLRDPEVVVRKAAARALWQAGPAAKQGDGVARLTEALADKDDIVRQYAARALGMIGPEAKPAVPALLERLKKDEERDVREHAAKALGLIGAQAIGPLLLPEIVVALIKGLTDEAGDVRENSARALGQLNAKEAISHLEELLQDRRSTEDRYRLRARTAAAEALQRLYGRQIYP
jgi:HEAT repeat protein